MQMPFQRKIVKSIPMKQQHPFAEWQVCTLTEAGKWIQELKDFINKKEKDEAEQLPWGGGFR